MRPWPAASAFSALTWYGNVGNVSSPISKMKRTAATPLSADAASSSSLTANPVLPAEGSLNSHATSATTAPSTMSCGGTSTSRSKTPLSLGVAHDSSVADRPDTRQRNQTGAENKIKATITARIEEAKGAAQVACGEPRRIGWAHVVAAQQDDDEAYDTAPESEAVAMRLVTNHRTAQRRKVTDVHTEGHGYDPHSERGSEQRHVEHMYTI